MTEEAYKAPESNLVSEKIGNNRPTSITIICVVGFIGALLSVPLFFSAIAKSIGVWYQLYLALVSIETFAKRPLLPDYCVRLKFQSSKYSIYSSG